MKKRSKWKQRTGFVTLLLILSFAGTGCGDRRQTEETVPAFKAGALSDGYFFEEDGIVISSGERFLYSDWEPVEFDYICMDPTCSHLTESCSARTIQDEPSVLKDFSVAYQDRLIILHAYYQLTVNELSETAQEWVIVYQTDVYEADPDGSNRRKMATFQGAIDSPAMVYAAVLAEGKLYFGGPTENRERMELDTQGLWMMLEEWVSDAIYCLDLNDYTLDTFAVTENREGRGYQYQLYEYDDMIYAIISNFQGDSAVWYRIDPEAGGCEEISCFDSNVARFQGAIGDTVYYWYESSWKTLYARELAAEAEEHEIISATGENMIVIPFVVDGQILCMTDYRFEGENRMAEYTVYDPDGNVLDVIRYDDYITLLDVIGDKIIYFRGYPEWEVWWVDKEDIRDLSDKGVRIGPLNGAMLDKLAN
ncbi:MAG: DUF5050 domain-containing protein [Acetatifactor sp.]|nr:DUF5050 domain-containing protein [Acetatifactor sp.]